MYDKLFKITFNPDEELIDFATSFSDNYPKLKVGLYQSRTQKYNIKYLPKLTDNKTGERVYTGARVVMDGGNTGLIHIDKSIFKNKKYTPDFVFFIILWCIVQHRFENLLLSDKITAEYYVKTKRSRNNCAIGFIELMSNRLTEENIKRIELIGKHLKNDK